MESDPFILLQLMAEVWFGQRQNCVYNTDRAASKLVCLYNVLSTRLEFSRRSARSFDTPQARRKILCRLDRMHL
jgi:hypothetical protein